jgi:hypothetical protein
MSSTDCSDAFKPDVRPYEPRNNHNYKRPVGFINVSATLPQGYTVILIRCDPSDGLMLSPNGSACCCITNGE